jgi:arginyl-tRNA synthetase
MKKLVVDVLEKALKKKGVKISKEEIEAKIEVPPSIEMGDYAFPCFFLAEKLRDSPHEIAIELRELIGSPDDTDFDDIQTKGPYINFFIDRKNLARKVVWEAITKKKEYGKTKIGKGKRTMIEFSSPNTNKPLHLGHLRNIAIGESLSRISEFNGEKVIRANLNNDRGIHICKSMLAYQKWGKDQTPEDKKIKSDHFVGIYYVMFEKKFKENKKLIDEAQELLKKWEEKDKSTLLLWKLMNNWAIEGFEKTYKTFGIKHDVTFSESKIYTEGKDIIEQGIKKNLFKKEKTGEVKIDLEKEGLGEKVLLRQDGTSIYIVQDLALAKIKFDKYKLDKSFYVVANEQEYHFKVLFSILEKLGFKNKELKHISYGMVNLPEGRMKSREGTVVDADELIESVRLMAAKELEKREKLSKNELEKRSLIIALAAIKYMLLKVDIKKNMLFNPKESISFEGDTGPYIQYSYARASSILKKAKTQEKFKIEDLDKKELELVQKISQFQDVVIAAFKAISPSLIANYSYQLAQIFNEFYHECPVIGSENEPFRLALVEAFRQVLKNSLSLLGIDVLEEM